MVGKIKQLLGVKPSFKSKIVTELQLNVWSAGDTGWNGLDGNFFIMFSLLNYPAGVLQNTKQEFHS